MPLKINVTQRAKDDLETIWRYTNETWGEVQADQYVTALFERCLWLADNANVGKLRADIKDNYRSFPQGSHVVFYIVREEAIDILGIAHKSMDILNYFEDE
jgi:toxin ParE1/3/4